MKIGPAQRERPNKLPNLRPGHPLVSWVTVTGRPCSPPRASRRNRARNVRITPRLILGRNRAYEAESRGAYRSHGSEHRPA